MTENEEFKVAPVDPEADMPERVKGFNEELKAILGKYELGIAAVAQLTPDGRISASPQVLSVRKPVAPQAPVAEAPAPLSE